MVEKDRAVDRLPSSSIGTPKPCKLSRCSETCCLRFVYVTATEKTGCRLREKHILDKFCHQRALKTNISREIFRRDEKAWLIRTSPVSPAQIADYLPFGRPPNRAVGLNAKNVKFSSYRRLTLPDKRTYLHRFDLACPYLNMVPFPTESFYHSRGGVGGIAVANKRPEMKKRRTYVHYIHPR